MKVVVVDDQNQQREYIRENDISVSENSEGRLVLCDQKTGRTFAVFNKFCWKSWEKI